MAISKAMLAALKALSYPDFNEKKIYKLHRKLINVTSPYYIRPFYKMWDAEVKVENYCVPVRIFLPKIETIPNSLIIFFHGGGWVTGNINSYTRTCANMAKQTESIVVSVDYRLAPEYHFPIGLRDCYAVVKKILLDETLFHIKTDKISLMGDSAGGNLVAAVSLLARDRGDFLPHSQILFYPAVYNDYSENSPFNSVITNGKDYLLTAKRIQNYIELYIDKSEDLQSPYMAPYLAEDLSNQPKTLIITAEYDPLRDEGEAYGKRLKEAGNEVMIYRMQDAIHGFLSLPPNFEHVKKGYQVVNKFLNNRGNKVE